MTDEGMKDGRHEDLPPREPDETCNARRTDGSGYCGQPAGWGTDLDQGRCKFHGGSTENQEKHVMAELEDAAEHASTALQLQLKHLLAKIEDPEEDVDAGELDRLARTVLDRTGHGPSEKREVENTGDEPLNEIVVDFENVDT